MGHLRRVGRLVAFDLDGTLVDSRQDLADSANQLVVERGGRALPIDAVAAMVGEGAALLVRRALTAAGLGVDDSAVADALSRFLQIYDERLLASTTLYAGVLDAVRAARQGAVVAVLTNKPLHHTTRLLQGLAIDHLFDAVVGGDNPHGRKPAPGALLALMGDAGADGPATLMVGDSLVDADTARAAGTQGCLVAFGFGYRRIPADSQHGCRVADTAEDLAEIVERFVISPAV